MSEPERLRNALLHRLDPQKDVYYFWEAGGKILKVYDNKTGQVTDYPVEIPTSALTNPSNDEVISFIERIINYNKINEGDNL